MNKRRLVIESLLAEDAWRGEVDLPDEDPEALERVWRLFNRVEPEDSERLEKWGYRLPSLSIGDRVQIDGKDYWVNDLGWVERKEDLAEFIKRLEYLRSGKSWT
jgi:hypothetical protein